MRHFDDPFNVMAVVWSAAIICISVLVGCLGTHNHTGGVCNVMSSTSAVVTSGR